MLGGVSLGGTLSLRLGGRLARPPRALLLMASGGRRVASVRRRAVRAAMDALGDVKDDGAVTLDIVRDKKASTRHDGNSGLSAIAMVPVAVVSATSPSTRAPSVTSKRKVCRVPADCWTSPIVIVLPSLVALIGVRFVLVTLDVPPAPSPAALARTRSVLKSWACTKKNLKLATTRTSISAQTLRGRHRPRAGRTGSIGSLDFRS